MSHYQGSSYRPAGDLYRPGLRPHADRHPGAHGHARPGDHARSPAAQGAGRAPPRNAAYRGHQHAQHPSSRAAAGPYGSHKSPSGAGFQHGARPLPHKRPADTYHQAYLQTQVESQLWMGDLDPNWTEHDIMRIWTQAGEAPAGVKIMRDRQGRPQYSFVTFAGPDAVASALRKNRSQVPGSLKVFKLNWASGSSQGDQRGAPGRTRNHTDAGRGHSDYSLFVGDLATEVTEPELFSRFNQELPGEVKQVKIMLDVASGASKGFGFVRFHSVDAQQKALKIMNGVVLGQRPIRVGIANGGASLDASAPGAKKASEALPAAIHIAQAQPALSPFTDPYNTAITIKGLISAITRDELVAHFLPFGHLIYCKVDYANGVAYIKYLLRASAERALLYMHGLVVNGSRLVLRWGRSTVDSEGATRFAPAVKGGGYTASQKLPEVNRSPPTNVVFEDLDQDQIRKLSFFADLPYTSVKDSNEADLQRLNERRKYLQNAF